MEEEKGTTGSINLSLNGREEKINLSGQVHHLPCCIKFNGPCNVSQYFKPKLKGMEIDGLAVEEAHFRGRKLQGTTISLPNGYAGFVLVKNNSGKRKAYDVSEGNSNDWEMKAKFDKLTYWNHDTPPSKDDPFLRSFHWFTVAEANFFPPYFENPLLQLHKQVKAEDLATIDAALA
ncbi:hypothetical protein GOBAR_DD27415 [Gossypium barbadense]|nr:hypothetical protein GOBAR_DD27415 [Gossypium barbadense]